jgi:hypothetical protein
MRTSPVIPGPRGGGFDSAAAEAQRKAESRARYTKGRAPEPTYRDPEGTVHPVDPKDRRIEELRRELDRERWANRAYREHQYYGPYYGRPVVVYHDPYNSWFWWWLLDQNLQTRAYWAYNHRGVMDEARYRDLLARDARLEAEVRKLEAQKVPPDPAYEPPGIDPDLMYTDQYVTAAYNPQPPAPRPPGASLRAGLGVLVRALIVIAVVAFLIWLVFFKRWGGTEGGGPRGGSLTSPAAGKGS